MNADKRQPAPWLLDQRPDLWVKPGLFALIINRRRSHVYRMLHEGSIEHDFRYPVYRDPLGNWFIRISELELTLATQLKVAS